MLVPTVVVTLVLALAVAGSAVGKLTRAAPVMASMREVGVPDARVPALAGIEIVGAVGLAVPAIGVLAAAGVLLYFVLAVGAHLRVRMGSPVPAGVLAAVALVALVLRAATA